MAAAQQRIHHSVLYSVRRHQSSRDQCDGYSEAYRIKQQHTLKISDGYYSTDPVDGRSAQYFVDYLHSTHLHPHPIRTLELSMVTFSAEALAVLCNLFASDTTPRSLTQVRLCMCLCSQLDWPSQLLASLQTNTSVTDLKIDCNDIGGEHRPTLNSDVLADLIENNPNMQRITFDEITFQLRNESRLRRALQQASPNLKEFHLMDRGLSDACLHVFTDGLVGNTTMDVLEIRVLFASSYNQFNPITAVSDIARLLESTQLKTLICDPIGGIISDSESARRLAAGLFSNRFMHTLNMQHAKLSSSVAVMIFQALGRNTTMENLILGRIEQGDLRLMETLPVMKGLKSFTLDSGSEAWRVFLRNQALPALRQNTSLEELPHLTSGFNYGYDQHRDEIVEIRSIMARNRNLKRTTLLLQLQPNTGKLIPSSSWILRRAIAQLARSIPSGASAIFQMLQTRPTLFETPMRPPPQPVVAELDNNAAAAADDESNINNQEQLPAASPRQVDVEQQRDRLEDNNDDADNESNNNNNNEQHQHDRINDDDESKGNNGRKRARLA